MDRMKRWAALLIASTVCAGALAAGLPETEAETALLMQYAQTALGRNNFANAVVSLEMAEKLNTNKPDVFHFMLGQAYAGTREWSKAAAAYEKYLRLAGAKAAYAREAADGLKKVQANAEKARQDAADNQLAAQQMDKIRAAEKLEARPSERFLIMLGGGGEPKKNPATMFDGTLVALGKFLKERPWKNFVAFDGSRANSDSLVKAWFPEAFNTSSFTENNFNAIVGWLSRETKAGDQILLVIDTHGAMKSAGEATHSVAVGDTDGPVDRNDLKGARKVSLDALGKLAAHAKEKGIALAIVDLSAHSGNALALANETTCVVSSTGPAHLRSADFAQKFIERMKAGRSLEAVFLEARRSTADSAFPMISTPEGTSAGQVLYPLLTPYLYTYDSDPRADKMAAYLKAASGGAGAAAREKADADLGKFLDGLGTGPQAPDAARLAGLVARYKDKQDRYIGMLRSVAALGPERGESFTGSAEIGNRRASQQSTLTVEEMLDMDVEAILKNLRSARDGTKDAETLAQFQAAIDMHQKIHDRKAALLSRNPELQDYPSRRAALLGEMRGGAGSPAHAIAAEERKLYDSLYRKPGQENRPGEACKKFIL
jgi:hypothetical protein